MTLEEIGYFVFMEAQERQQIDEINSDEDTDIEDADNLN